MFTGIIETTGEVLSVSSSGQNITFRISSPISALLKPDQSISHEGVCLTVESVSADSHTVTAIQETLSKTNVKQWTKGSIVNLERCMPADGRFDGHIVQGHVDCTAVCTAVNFRDGSWEYEFRFPEEFEHLVIEKGSICINGTSLTAYGVDRNNFKVSIIPYTYDHTTISKVVAETEVNIEFDVLGKYLYKFSMAALHSRC